MALPTENEQVQDVAGRLREKFPDVPGPAIDRLVEDVHLQITGPIRDFVPLLVEHAARDQLQHWFPAREPQLASVS